MGYLTTICFHNDAYSQFKEHPEETVKNILEAMSASQSDYYSVGNHCNPMTAMKPSHADESRLFVQTGNSLVEIGYYSTIQDKEYYKQVIKIAKHMISYAEKKLKG